MRWITVTLGVAALLCVATVVIALRDGPLHTVDTGRGASSSGSAAGTRNCPAVKKAASPTPYAVTGYWLNPEDDPCTLSRQLQEIHQVGGDTVIRLGFALSPRGVDGQGRILEEQSPGPDKQFEMCSEHGLTCVRAAEKDLQKANPGNRITGTYVYRTDEVFGPGLLACTPMEHKIVDGPATFYRLLVPDDGSASCDFTSAPRGYHLIIVAAGDRDSLAELLDLGDRLGIQVFPTLPVAPRDPAAMAQADVRHLSTLTALTRRVLQDYKDRFRKRKSLGGFYQAFEVQMRDWSDTSKVPTLQLYSEQHTIAEQELPGKPIMISPYIDARRQVAYSATPAQVAKAFEILASTGVEIIAPQDGRGTGKVGLFWPEEKNQPVDDRLKPVVGESTYATAYYAGTRDYYRAMADARDELAAQGVHAQLWANLEGFEPTGTTPCRSGSTRGDTDKPRLDTQVTLAGPYVSKLISFMWTDFFTCGSPSLAKQIDQDWNRPIVIEADHAKHRIQDGLEILGYNVEDAKVTLSWDGLDTPRVVDSSKVGWRDPDPIPDVPAAVERTWIPVDWATVPKGVLVRVQVTAEDGRKATESVYYHHSV
ncbi:hypothetical protein Pth03_21860 [Planotetraspora thailandica]|uniref:DUF4434 domain-containing protein n=1 Tax=Planotetraspora thailandica TaxID=487172 RepID=A0A8J3XSZ8_9ACTN|nr:DUF4434 domain-containing protein [Planotetraspora thailandica]GII53797.1 hypothetical protein Pth03_21860 [Planotetraspora thailandica]